MTHIILEVVFEQAPIRAIKAVRDNIIKQLEEHSYEFHPLKEGQNDSLFTNQRIVLSFTATSDMTIDILKECIVKGFNTCKGNHEKLDFCKIGIKFCRPIVGFFCSFDGTPAPLPELATLHSTSHTSFFLDFSKKMDFVVKEIQSSSPNSTEASIREFLTDDAIAHDELIVNHAIFTFPEDFPEVNIFYYIIKEFGCIYYDSPWLFFVSNGRANMNNVAFSIRCKMDDLLYKLREEKSLFEKAKSYSDEKIDEMFADMLPEDYCGNQRTSAILANAIHKKVFVRDFIPDRYVLFYDWKKLFPNMKTATNFLHPAVSSFIELTAFLSKNDFSRSNDPTGMKKLCLKIVELLACDNIEFHVVELVSLVSEHLKLCVDVIELSKKVVEKLIVPCANFILKKLSVNEKFVSQKEMVACIKPAVDSSNDLSKCLGDCIVAFQAFLSDITTVNKICTKEYCPLNSVVLQSLFAKAKFHKEDI